MKKSTVKLLIAAICLIVAGGIILLASLFAGGKANKGIGGKITDETSGKAYGFGISTEEYTSTEYDVSGEISGISAIVGACDISIEPSRDGKCSVACRIDDRFDFSATNENGVLKIVRTAKSGAGLLDGVSISIGDPGEYIKVYLPEAEYDFLKLESESGNVKICRGLSFGKAEISASSGDIELYADCGAVELRASSGDITLGGISAESAAVSTSSGSISLSGMSVGGEVELETSSGSVDLSELECLSLRAESTSGDITLEDVYCSAGLLLESSSGEIELYDSDSRSIEISTSSGDIGGRLLSEKIFEVSRTSGDISVPFSQNGDVCRISTSSGDVEFEAPRG